MIAKSIERKTLKIENISSHSNGIYNPYSLLFVDIFRVFNDIMLDDFGLWYFCAFELYFIGFFSSYVWFDELPFLVITWVDL